MNKCFLIGRLTRDPELRFTQSQVPVATFCIAVDRKFKDQSGERQTDFINIVAWRGTAEFVQKYFQKGSKIVVVGSIQVRSYDDKDGNKRTATEVIADEVEFGDSKPQGHAPQSDPYPMAPSDDETSLPFDL